MRTPFAVSKSMICGSFRCANRLLVARGVTTWVETISSSSSQRSTSTSCTAVSRAAMEEVYDSGTVGLRWAQCTISGSPMRPESMICFSCRYPAS